MNFRLQDIIKMLIPGTVFLLISYLLFFDLSQIDQWLKKDFVSLYVIVFLVTVYVIGYFIDWFGSMFERLFYWRFARPSHLLLNNDQKTFKNRFSLSNRDEIVEYLCQKLKKSSQYPFTKENSLKLFKMANYLKDYNKSTSMKERLNELYFTKIFSRNLTVTFLIGFKFYLIAFILGRFDYGIAKFDFNWYCITVFVLFFMSLARWRENAMYYTRCVFYSVLEGKTNN